MQLMEWNSGTTKHGSCRIIWTWWLQILKTKIIIMICAWKPLCSNQKSNLEKKMPFDFMIRWKSYFNLSQVILFRNIWKIKRQFFRYLHILSNIAWDYLKKALSLKPWKTVSNIHHTPYTCTLHIEMKILFAIRHQTDLS